MTPTLALVPVPAQDATPRPAPLTYADLLPLAAARAARPDSPPHLTAAR